MEVGSAVEQVVQAILDDPVLERLPTAGRLVRLRKRFGDMRLEAACQRALAFGDPSYKTIKRILVQGLEQEQEAIPLTLPPATIFARGKDELVGALAEVTAWN
jgi:hypothetical protein